MKKLILFTAGVLIFTGANAQVLPTQNFESWGSGSPPDPTGWASANILYAFGAGDTVCHRSSTANSGSFSMKLETIKMNSNPAASIGVPDTVCFAFTGTIIPFPTPTIKTGYPYSTRPQFLDFYYKYTPVANDSATAGIVLTKWNTGTNSRDTVAKAMKHMGAQASFTFDSLTLIYTTAYATSGNPDSAFVYFASSNIKTFAVNSGTMSLVYTTAKLGSMLWVDDWYSTSVGINENKQQVQFNAYPVPANEQYTLRFEKAESKIIGVYDVTGKLMEEIKSSDKVVIIKTSAYNNGVYFIRVKDSSGKSSSAEKFVVSH